MNMGRQCGASLIAAIFLITVLAIMGAFLSRLLVTTSAGTITEWYSAQALYAAESGVDYAAYQLARNTPAPPTPPTPGTATAAATASDMAVDTAAWFSTTVTAVVVTPTKVVYEIRSTGVAGGTSANPMAQRTLVVQFMP